MSLSRSFNYLLTEKVALASNGGFCFWRLIADMGIAYELRPRLPPSSLSKHLVAWIANIFILFLWDRGCLSMLADKSGGWSWARVASLTLQLISSAGGARLSVI
jgi:hypothetical protein